MSNNMTNINIEILTNRLEQLKSERHQGRLMIADPEKKLRDIQTTILRIDGAIEVLDEMIASEKPPA